MFPEPARSGLFDAEQFPVEHGDLIVSRLKKCYEFETKGHC